MPVLLCGCFAAIYAVYLEPWVHVYSFGGGFEVRESLHWDWKPMRLGIKKWSSLACTWGGGRGGRGCSMHGT